MKPIKVLEKLNESYSPTGYTKVMQAILDGIEDDTDEEALQKYLQDIIGFCRTVAEDFGVLVESNVKESSDYGSDVEETSFKQGNEEFFVQPYKYGDDSFNIKYETHGNRHITNEPYTIEGEYNFIYDEENKEVLTGMKKDGKVVPDNWGKMTNVSKDKWLEMVHNPEQDLIPWVQGAYLD